MHAVQAADERGLAAARGTDHRRGVVRRHRHVDVVQSLGLAEPGIELVDLDSNTHSLSLLP